LTSDELRVALAPSSTYRELLAREAGVTWLRALRRPAFVLLLIGITVSIAATGRVSLASIALTATAWSFAVVLQVAVGIAIIASSRSRRVSMPRALDLWFAGHLPWSAWLLLATAAIRLFPFLQVELFLLLMVLPMAWTAAIAAAYCRTVLGSGALESRLRAAAHQAVTLALLLSFIAWSAGGWFRLAG
jgi:hypothetical protein